MHFANVIRGAMLTAVVGLLAPSAMADEAENYPSQAVTLIVPFAPGGSTDTLARLVASNLEERWGTGFVVENRPGAGGNLGAMAVARAEPDGHTLVMGSIGTHAVNASLYANMPYDTIGDFQPLTLVAQVELVLVVHPSLEVESVEELVAYAKARPGELDYASGGNGASQHLAGELFKNLAEVDMVHVPYQGSGNAIADLLGGQVKVMFADMPLVAPHIESGRLRALAISGDDRSPAIDVPTVDEAGIEGFEAYAWYGMFAPAQTPEPIVNKLSAEIIDILGDPENRAFMENLGATPVGNTPDEFASFQLQEFERWAELMEPLGISLD